MKREVLQFTLEIFKLNPVVLIGLYSIGELDGDGMIGANDSYTQGYLLSAFYMKSGIATVFKTGR